MHVTKLRFADYEVDFARRELRKNGVRLRLEHKPFRVLELLLRSPGELVTRQELVSSLWPDSHVSFARGLNTAVNSLRQVLGESSREPHFIETRPGIGYRFSAPVEVVSGCGRNAQAYEDCLKGRYLLDRMEHEEIYKAIAFFKSAAADQTCYSLAHAGLAQAYCLLALLGSPSLEIAGAARSAAECALTNNPDLVDAQVSAGWVKLLFDRDWTAANAAVSRALTLNSHSAPALVLHAGLLCIVDGSEEAVQTCREALALNPLSFLANLALAACQLAARDFERAIDECWKILTLSHHFAPAQIVLALAYEQLGMSEEAAVEFQNAKSCAGSRTAIHFRRC